jgi:iron complex transport system ATP-binding protein
MQDFFSLNNFTCGYGKSFSLSDINFSLPKGAFGGIIGPNGSGKTTFFRGVTGELELKKGTAVLNNVDLYSMPLKEKARNIAVVTQFTEVFDITVEEYVLMGRMPYRNRWQFFENSDDIRIADKYMKETDVYHLRNKYMSQLSGGEQQLAGIARALTQEPELLLLDEPTSHLDITHQVQILNLIQRLSIELKLTVLMIIHDLNLAGEYCDYLVMMNSGNMHVKGVPEEVLNYKNIEEVYKTVVITKQNPLSKKPAIFLVSEKVLKNDEVNKK